MKDFNLHALNRPISQMIWHVTLLISPYLVFSDLYICFQHAGKHYTHKIDIYALGLIFFELVYPFDTQMERIHIMSDVKRLRFPDRFVKMMSKDEVCCVNLYTVK